MAGLRALSTEDVIRVAIARYLQFSYQGSVDRYWLARFCGSAPDSFSEEDIKDVELMNLLLVSAEKIGSQQFDSATPFLNQCDKFSSKDGTSVQRIVHYFCDALREKFDRETGRITSKGLKNKENLLIHPEKILVNLKPAIVVCYQKLPFYQVTQFAGMQAIIESVASAKRVHLIDLEVRCGAQCTVLMQALATQREPPVELLTITAVGTTSKQEMEETGKRLAYFAKTINLPFSFKVVMLIDIKDVKEDLFDIKDDEVVAVYSSFMLSHTIRLPNCLESLITVLRNMNPRVMVVIEVESNDSLLPFEDRFFEILFYYSTCFDCLDVCMPRSDTNRMLFEEINLGMSIRNIIANEGEERIVRHMKIDAWRAFLSRFGLVEAELSMTSLYQAELIRKNNFAGVIGNSCTFERNGKCLIVGWKGLPHLSLSVWKFRQDKRKICNMNSSSLLK